MNTAKIAALYASPIFNTLLRFPNFDPNTTLTRELQAEAMLEQAPRYRNGKYDAAASDDLSTTYRVSVNDFKNEKRYDAFGIRMHALVEGAYPERVYRWATQQLPTEHNTVEQSQRWVAEASSYTRDADREIVDSSMHYRFGSEADFAALVRGLRAYQRKIEKSLTKQEAQLRAYHRQQVAAAQVAAAQAAELAKLHRGHWLGAEKALTTAARVNEPSLTFLGDVAPTKELVDSLRYWAVPAEAGMSAALPAGTGIALKVITSGKQLIDGAIYLSETTFGKGTTAEQYIMRLGRLDMSRKQYGSIPLFQDDAPDKNLYVDAEWKQKEGQGYEIKLMQVTHYTTRAAEAAPMQAETQPAQPQPAKRSKRRELALAA